MSLPGSSKTALFGCFIAFAFFNSACVSQTVIYENNFDDDFVDTDDGPSSRDRDGVFYGIGAEVGPKDIGLGGITGNSGVRLRFGVDTFKDFESFRPNAALVFQF